MELTELLYGPMKKPILSWAATSPLFADKEEYPMFSRLVNSYVSYNSAIEELAVYYKWGKITLIVEQNSLHLTTASLLQTLLLISNPEIEITMNLVTTDSPDSQIRTNLKSAALDNTDAVILVSYCDIMRRAYKVASEIEEFDPLTVAIIGYEFTPSCGDPNINMDGLWNLMPKSGAEEHTVTTFFGDFEDGKWDFSPYVNYPYGNAIPDPEYEEEFRFAMGGNTYSAVQPQEQEPGYSGYLFDSIVLYLKSVHNLLSDTGVDYFADDTPDLSLGMANAYIRSTVLEDGITGVVSLDGKGERTAKVLLRGIKHVDVSYEDIDYATFNPSNTQDPLTIEQNEIVWAFGKTKN